MRILYITDALAVWGGIERVLSDKMNYLVQKYGYEVYVVTADQGDHPIPFPLDERIRVKAPCNAGDTGLEPWVRKIP